MQPLRLLLADDNEAVTKTLGWLLEALGHEVRLARNGTEALSAAQAFLPHAILLDIGLPDISGYDVCQQLRAVPELGQSIFIAQTGWGDTEHRRRSSSAGFHYHLVKPVDIHLLSDILSSLPAPLPAA